MPHAFECTLLSFSNDNEHYLPLDPNQNNGLPPRSNTSVITTTELKKIREQINSNKQNQSMVSVVRRDALSDIRRRAVIKNSA